MLWTQIRESCISCLAEKFSRRLKPVFMRVAHGSHSCNALFTSEMLALSSAGSLLYINALEWSGRGWSILKDMSAEDKVGFQEFSRAGYEVPPREQIEEASAIAENLLEGQQAVGQGLADPYTHAVHYLEKHNIVQILQVTIETCMGAAS